MRQETNKQTKKAMAELSVMHESQHQAAENGKEQRMEIVGHFDNNSYNNIIVLHLQCFLFTLGVICTEQMI